jgi:small-conductance mechanosensitive channel
MKDKNTSTSIIILLLIVCILWIILLGGFVFPEISIGSDVSDRTNLFKRSLLALFGLTISGLLIFWIVYNTQNLSGKSGMTSFILNLLIVVSILALLYRTMNVKIPHAGANTKKNAFFDLLINLIFYIPCIFSGLFDKILNLGKNEYMSSTKGSFLMLLIVIILNYI